MVFYRRNIKNSSHGHCEPGQIAILEWPCSSSRLLALGLSKQTYLDGSARPLQDFSKRGKVQPKKHPFRDELFLWSGSNLPLQLCAELEQADQELLLHWSGCPCEDDHFWVQHAPVAEHTPSGH